MAVVLNFLIPICGGLVVLPFVYALFYFIADPKSLRRFPSPSIAAFTPFWVIWQNDKGVRYLAVEKSHRELGPVVRIAPNSVSFADPKAYKDIYGHGSPIIKDTFYDNASGGGPHAAMADTSSRELHTVKRKNVSNIFSAKNIATMEPKVARATRNLLNAIHVKAKGGMISPEDQYTALSTGEFDLRPWMNFFSWDAISDMLWSAPYGFLLKGNDYCHSMGADGKVTMVPAMESFRVGVHFNTMCAQAGGSMAYRAARWLTQGMYRNQAADHFGGMSRYGTMKRLESTPEEIDFFSFFPREVTEKRKTPMEIPDLISECSSYLNAGNDTTQITLTNTMFQLASHPELQQKLFNELCRNLPPSSRPIAPSPELLKIPYLTACIDETFRLMPPVRFGLPRRTTGKGSVISGHFIPAGVTVSSSVHVLHRDENLFHKALEWIPERWLPGNVDVSEEERKNLKDFVLPFTLGGRACIGRNLAYMEISICIAALVMAFEWEISDASKNAFGHFERFNTSPVDLMITAKPRSEAWGN